MSFFFTVLLFVALAIAGCSTNEPDTIRGSNSGSYDSHSGMESGTGVSTSAEVSEFTLQTSIVDGRMVFLGYGGVIDGIVNPTLVAQAGQAVHLTLINGDGISHDLSIPDLGIKSSLINGTGKTAKLNFELSPEQAGSYTYYCTVSGHRQAGMEGRLVVVVGREVENVSSASI